MGLIFLGGTGSIPGVTLWSDPGSVWISETGPGRDLLEGAVKRDDSANDTLYFKFRVDPQSDSSTEEYFAAFQLYESEAERVAIGNAFKAWAYSAFFKHDPADESGAGSAYLDLRSSILEPSGTTTSYELPRRGVERTIVFKVQYVPGSEDLVTVWLNPDLSSGANEVYQAETLTTRFNANASFDELRLRHSGGGPGWIFSDMAIATAFSDFVDSSSAKPVDAAPSHVFNNQRFSFQSWQRESGMPRNAIRAIAQARDGYLWLASVDGLTRFDGVRFVAVNLPATSSAAIQTMISDAQGALWIGTTNGLDRYFEGNFTYHGLNEGLPSKSVTALADDNAGRVWIGTESGLVMWQAGAIRTIEGTEKINGGRIQSLCQDKSGSMWIAVSGTGVFHYKSGILTAVDEAEAEPLLRQSHCLLVDGAGRVWVGSGEDFLLCRESGQWRRFRIPRQSPAPFISSLAEGADGTVWAGSAGEGLFQFKRGKLSAIDAAAGLLDDQVTALFVDGTGRLWVGSEAGLNRLQQTHTFTIGQTEGLGYGAVHGLAEVATNVIWAIKPKDGIYRWEGRTFTRLTAAGVVPRDSNLGPVLVTRDGNCWVAASGGLLLFRDPQAAADESRLFELPNVSIVALAEDAEGAIWAGCREGSLWRLAKGKWERQNQVNFSQPITALSADVEGGMWVGTAGEGVFRWGRSNTLHFTKANGLGSDVIRALHCDRRGTIWIATDGGGLSSCRGGRLTHSTGLAQESIYQILEDDSGRLWVGGNSGIACLGPLSGNEPNLNSYSIGSVARTPSEVCSTGFSPAGLKARSGLLWFATQKGIVLADPQHVPTNIVPGAMILEDVLVDGSPAPGFKPLTFASRAPATGSSNAGVVRLDPGKHQVELRYTVPNFDRHPEAIRFRYKLEGLDADWVEAGARRSAFYNYVPPGDYRFRLAVSEKGTPWVESRLGLGLTVSRRLWQRGWVMVLAAMGLLVAVGAGVRFFEKYQSHRRLKRLEQESALERERRRIAQDLHDEMGAKLCRISFLSEHAQRQDPAQGEIRDQITTIADASRELLHSLDEIVWAVNPQNDTLEHLASYINQYAQNYFHSTGIECELDMPDQFAPHPVSSQARHHLFLAVHEAFTNILKHSGATRARLGIACSGSRFEVRVEDNGKGFKPAPPEGNHSTNNSEDGLRNMRERLESVGGQCHLESVSGRGTIIRFILPLQPTNGEKRSV